jgi:hypothetical protein
MKNLPSSSGAAVPQIAWDATVHEIAAQIERAQETGYGSIVKQELVSRFMMLRHLGRWDQAKGLLDIYADQYSQPSPAIDLPRIASIEFVDDDRYRVLEFVLRQDAAVRVHAVGESDYYRLFDFGGIEDTSTGRLVWRMRLEQSEDAGGSLKNRMVDQVIELPEGTYRLHYKTDDGHSFGRWNDIPPDELFWGISLYLADPTIPVEDVVGSVRTIESSAEMRLLDSVEFTRGNPPIGPWEYFALVIFLFFLASAVLVPPVRLLYRKVLKRNAEEIPESRRRWTRVITWVAGVNGAVCLIQIIPALPAGRLERLVANGIPLLPAAWWTVLISVPLASICMVGFLIAAVVVSWLKQLWKQPLRIYYTLVATAAVGYLLLLNYWRLIILPV